MALGLEAQQAHLSPASLLGRAGPSNAGDKLRRGRARTSIPAISLALLAAAACWHCSPLFAWTWGRTQPPAAAHSQSQAASLTGTSRHLRPTEAAQRTVMKNWLDMLEEAAGVPTPEAADPPIPESVQPLDAALVKGELTAYMLEEKAMSMSGEDFEVKSPTGEVVLRIGGGNRVPIPGVVWDKLTVSTPSGEVLATLDRQMLAMTTTYDILRPDGSKFGKIDKAMFSLTSTFELWQDGDGHPGPLLKAEGSFSAKKYALKSHTGAVVASVARLPGFSSGNVDNYQVIVGPHVDATLALAMAVVIDEVHDEENPDQENSGEDLRNLMEDNSGLPMPKAPSAPIPASIPALDPVLMKMQSQAFELEEKALSMTGEDFEVKSPTGELVLKIGGGNRIPIAGMPVWDKLTISDNSGATIATLDRELVAMTPTYDVYRADGSKFGKIDKAIFGFTETFEFYLEGESSPVLKAEGTFSERRYDFKDRDGTEVACIARGYFQSSNENRYHAIVGPKVDPTMVLAMAVVIDEVHDEAEQKEEGGGGGFPFR